MQLKLWLCNGYDSETGLELLPPNQEEALFISNSKIKPNSTLSKKPKPPPSTQMPNNSFLFKALLLVGLHAVADEFRSQKVVDGRPLVTYPVLGIL